MKMKIFASILLLSILLTGCEKECEKIVSDYDGLSINEYYEAEIFNQSFLEIYGDWKLYEVSGGIHGGGHDLNFDILKIKKYGIYAFIKNDDILEFGRINIDEQTHESLSITFIPHVDSEIFMYDSEKNIIFHGIDTIFLNSPCCDRYNYRFTREE